MRLTVALPCLLALAACGGGAPPPVNTSTESPAPSDPGPEASHAPVGQGNAPPPNVPNPTQAPPSRFIVCPGNPRCPAEGTRPGNR